MNKIIFNNGLCGLGVNLKGQILIPTCWKTMEDDFMVDITTVDKLLAILVRKEIQKLVKDRTLFSAWDITKAIRAAVGDNYEIKHGDVRSVVKDWFANGGSNDKGNEDWSRTLVELTNGKITNVYHPLTILVEKYPEFASLADTFGKNATKESEVDYEQEYCKLFDAAWALQEAIEVFIEGNMTITQLEEAKNEFESELSDTESEKNDN